MNKRNALMSIFLFIFGFAILAIQTNKVMAYRDSSSGPLTNPISYFTVTGSVIYKLTRGYIPAANVAVNATSQSGTTYSAVTGNDGYYSMTVNSGTYLVRPSDAFNSIFMPARRIIDVFSNVSRVNFVGIRS